MFFGNKKPRFFNYLAGLMAETEGFEPSMQVYARMLITRRLEFDAGHRIPDHRSQCRHLHGHRYVLEITLSGGVIRQEGDPANGMP